MQPHNAHVIAYSKGPGAMLTRIHRAMRAEEFIFTYGMALRVWSRDRPVFIGEGCMRMLAKLALSEALAQV